MKAGEGRGGVALGAISQTDKAAEPPTVKVFYDACAINEKRFDTAFIRFFLYSAAPPGSGCKSGLQLTSTNQSS